jgi:hypothetical protein
MPTRKPSFASARDLIAAGEPVVVDTASPFVYIGRLVAMTKEFVILADADAHDMADSPGSQTKERYIRETKRFGVKENRRAVRVAREKVIALTRLSDVVEV